MPPPRPHAVPLPAPLDSCQDPVGTGSEVQIEHSLLADRGLARTTDGMGTPGLTPGCLSGRQKQHMREFLVTVLPTRSTVLDNISIRVLLNHSTNPSPWG